MEDKEKKLLAIFDNDPLDLLNVKPLTTIDSPDKKLIDSFLEIVEFHKSNNRLPIEFNGTNEHGLFSRLKGLKNDTTKLAILSEYDELGLLQTKEKEYLSIDDVLNDDVLGLLDDESEGLFDLVHVKPIDKDRAEADFVARRKACVEFEKYEHLFKNCQTELKTGERKMTKFHENQIQEGAFFVLGGMLVYVEKLIDITVDKFGKRDGRTKLVFENGTESNMLFRSLGKGLFQDGQGITFTNEELNKQFENKYNNITENDKASGFIYILKSKSDKPEIKDIKNLYKIGFSTTTVEERVKNAIQEPTYLMADVQILMTYQCYNMNTNKLELLLHNFFGKSCLDIDVYDLSGKRHTPREWFIAPIEVIDKAIELIVSGAIINFKYDPLKEEIIER